MAETPTTEQLAAATLAASRAMLGAVARSMAGALEQVTLPQFRALVVMDSHGPQRTGALADRLGLHPSTFTRTVDRLVRDGWAQRLDNPDNRREVHIQLTEAGRGLVQVVMDLRRRELRTILGRVPAHHRAALVIGMNAFAGAAGEPHAADLLLLAI